MIHGCCDFCDTPEQVTAHLARWRAEYAFTRDGTPIVAPAGWRILAFGDPIPAFHREYIAPGGWARPRRGHNTMTPLFARPAGYVRAYATLDTLAAVGS